MPSNADFEQPVLSVQNYQPNILGRKLLAPLTLQLFPGDFLLVRAPSGAGKTRWLEDIAYKRSPSIQCRGAISYLPQTLDLVENSSVVDNALLGHTAKIKWWQSLFKKPSESHRATQIQELRYFGLEEEQKIAAQLSGGEKQRLAVVRALQSDKRLWLFDEPISQLDPAWAQKVFSRIYLQAQVAKAAVICVVHQEVSAAGLPNVKTLMWDKGWLWKKD